jgi:large subunit ribosomal protein L1
MANAAPKKKAKDAAKEKQKKKMRTEFKQYDLQDADQFSLCDAMR